MKYVKVGDYNSVIIFPITIEHSKFKHLEPTSAGFCNISNNKVTCFGESISLDIKSDEESDSFDATIQYFGIKAVK